MTRERMRWYVDIQPTVAIDDGRVHVQPPTIHDDDDYARDNGLRGIIADGMISTNWIASLLFDVFGADVLKDGALKTKYIRPIYEDEVIVSCVKVTSTWRDVDDKVRYEFDVWCETDQQVKVTVGTASILSTRS
jgi:hypothetical protein